VPRTTILTATYQPEKLKYLREAAESVYAQTDTDWQWVIVVDGGPQEVFEEVHRITAGSRKVYVWRKDTTEEERKLVYSPAVIFNYLADALDTPRFCWLSDDDLLRPQYLELLNAKLDETGGDIAFGAIQYAAENGRGHFHLTNITGLKDCYYPGSPHDPCGTLDGGCFVQTKKSWDELGWKWPTDWKDAWQVDGLYMRKLMEKHRFHHVQKVLLTHRRTRVSTHSKP
jgi:hypothetical protein